ncbi:MAG: DUF1543 domain-containing protein [Moraxella sp.]
MKLIMAKIGARPKGRLIEQHDVVFGVVNGLSDMVALVDQAWSEVKGKWHIDAWREVQRVGDYRIGIAPPSERVDTTEHTQQPQLYFVNLGGYLPNQFEEFHYKTLVVAESMAKATAAVKTSDFYRDYCFENDDSRISGAATSHVDDKHLLDIDDLHCVAALLADTAALQITPLTPAEQQSMPEDFLHIGYLPRKSLLQLAD